MVIDKIRMFVQAGSFLLLTYGGRIGIHLGYAIPCFACPYVPGCGGYCFLMFFQRVGLFGIAVFDQLLTYAGLWNLMWFAVFAVSALLLSKLWCGWICPFGTLQDGLSALRRKMGVQEVEFPWYVRDAIKPVKYIFLGMILIVPLLLAMELLPPDFYILFCKICPAHPIMPLFAGDFRRLALDYTNWVTLLLTFVNLSFAGIVIAGSFFKDRFFCLVCPMLPLIQLFNRFSPVQFEKKAGYCSGCGNCQRLCPMDIREVHDAKEDGNVMTEGCTLCTQCMQACPVDNVLTLRFGKKILFSSAKDFVIQKNRKGN